MGEGGEGRVSHAFALWLGQQACATGVVSPPSPPPFSPPPLACCPTRDGGPAAMRTGAPGHLMRGVLFLIKDGQGIITIIIRRCTMEHASLRYGWEKRDYWGMR
ncbi:hypothetical protein CesoFtcFv8_008380 [Champsocephalus esox]|uniref:Uncharacterized protein n=1 Tax=Champsocephalus esox TaxID=159716 RepID=A0AAN8C7S3_9TELE|nr:hypothetical protein CesoFtcFv8_008380 [Champsocephalus esox]